MHLTHPSVPRLRSPKAERWKRTPHTRSPQAEEAGGRQPDQFSVLEGSCGSPSPAEVVGQGQTGSQALLTQVASSDSGKLKTS